MTDSTELLALRLGLIAIIFVLVLVTAFVLRSGLGSRPAARGRRSGRGARLVIVSPAETGLAPGDEFAVAGEMTIGRDSENSIMLVDPSVSGRHASLVRERDGFRLADLGSTNGTLVNGRPVGAGGAPLRGGEQIALGAVVLRFHS